eukprot:403352827
MDIQDLNLVINSISEQRPTPREVREHKDNLLTIQKQLHAQLTKLYERQIKLQQSKEYGVVGLNMHSISKNDLCQKLRSSQSSKQHQNTTTSSNYNTPQRITRAEKESLIGVDIKRKSSEINSKASLSTQKIRYVNENCPAPRTVFNKVVLKIENVSIYPIKKYKNLGIKIQIPKNSSPDEQYYTFVSRQFKPQSSHQFSETFVLLFKDDVQTRDKNFIISLIEMSKNGQPVKELGHKHTFMIEQLHEGKIRDKELVIYPEDQQLDSIRRTGHKLSYDNDSSLDNFQVTKRSIISKLTLKMQFIRDEEQTIQDLIQGMNQKLEEVQEAIEHLQVLDYHEHQSQFYQQFFANQSHSHQSNEHLSRQLSRMNYQNEDEMILPSSLLHKLDRLARDSQGTKSSKRAEIQQFYENQDVGTTLPDTYEKSKRPPQLSNFGNYDLPHGLEYSDQGFQIAQDQQNTHHMFTLHKTTRVSNTASKNDIVPYQQQSNQNLQGYPNILMIQNFPQTQKHNKRNNFNFVTQSEISSKNSPNIRDKKGHIRNSSSQEAGFYIAQHQLRGIKDQY